MPKLLHIQYTFDVPASALGPAFEPAARAIADVRGLKWKLWIMDEAAREAGGIYLFEDGAALEAFLHGPIVAQLRENPVFGNIRAQTFDVDPTLSAITRAPLG